MPAPKDPEKYKLFCKRNSSGHLGQVAWNKDLTKEIDKRVCIVSESNKGKHFRKKTEEEKKRLQIKMSSEDTRRKISKSKKGISHPQTEETKRKISKGNKGKNIGKKIHSKEDRLKRKIRMLSGLAAYCNKFIKNPSKPQVKLFELIRSWLPQAILNYPLKEVNRSLDVAIPDFKIWFEYDGSYWHQDQEKDLERENQIRSLGWKCIRYRDVIPTEEQLIIDIRKIL